MTSLPTQEDLETLPYFAILVLGARCARQVVPLFSTWQQAPQEHVRALSSALQAVEHLAACTDAATRAPLWLPTTQAVLLAAEAASAADMADAPPAALSAADATAELADAISPEGSRENAARAVCRAVGASALALEQAGEGDRDEFLVKLVELVEELRRHASAGNWTDETGVSLLHS